MTIDELYKLRKEVIENKEKFSELNKRYNKLLEKIFNRKKGHKKLTEQEYIRGESYIWYWERFLVLMLLTIIFKIPNDVTLFCIIGNFGLKLFDMYILLPKLWIKKQLKKVYETKEEQEQRELYEEVSKARSLYHELNKKYEQEFMKLSREEEQEYLSFLEDLGISWDLEESSNNNLVEVSSDVKMLEKVTRETREFI